MNTIPEYKILQLSSHQQIDTLSVELIFDQDSQFFDGHFDDFLVLPAVAQLFVAQSISEKEWGSMGAFKALRTVKFKDIIRPNIRLNLFLEYNRPSRKLLFQYTQMDNAKLKSLGKLCFES